MNQGKYVFSQLCDFLPKSQFDWFVKKYQGNKYVKTFTCWNHLLVMVFAQLTHRESLRDLIATLNAHKSKFNRLGFGTSVTRSNLSKANEQREAKIFEDMAYLMVKTTRDLRVDMIEQNFFYDGDVYDIVEDKQYENPQTGIMADQTIMFRGYKTKKQYATPMRRVVFYDKDGNRTFVFYTNNHILSAEDIALAYKYRWRVELFFKWVKQHLHVKEFYGTSENAVKIQLYCAIIAYCLVAIVERKMKLDMEMYELLRILSISLLDKTPLRDLLSREQSKESLQTVRELSLKFI